MSFSCRTQMPVITGGGVRRRKRCSGLSKNSGPSRNWKDLKRRLDYFGTF